MIRRNAIFEHAGLIAICAGAIVLIWAATLLMVSQLRLAAENEAAAMRQNLANSLAEHEASSVRAIDMSLVTLREAWLRDRPGFDAVVRRHEALLRKERIIQVAVIDAEGTLVYSRLPTAAGIDFSDRSYYREHRATGGADRLFISEPIVGRVTRQWAIQFTRPLRDAGGRFAGVIVVAVPPPALEHVYREIDLGPQGVITLARRDGQIVARTSELERSVGLPLTPVRDLGESGHFESRGIVDGVVRLVSYREVPDYGLVLFVGQGRDAVLAPFVRQRTYLYAFAVAATLLAACIGTLLGLRQRDRLRYRAERERMMLELHDGCIQSIYAVGLQLQDTRTVLAPRAPEADVRIAQAEADLNLVIQDLRAFIGAEKPAAVSGEQLRSEIERALPRTPRTLFHVQLEPQALEALAAEEATHVLRIVREAAANVVRHANASHARIRLARENGQFRLDITDNGDGVAPRAATLGLGLAHIEARARKLRGTAEIASGETGGTRVSVRFPEYS
jgi:signal transduction histidine kinase